MFVRPHLSVVALIAGQFGKGAVHFVGQALVPVLVEAQLVCVEIVQQLDQNSARKLHKVL